MAAGLLLAALLLAACVSVTSTPSSTTTSEASTSTCTSASTTSTSTSLANKAGGTHYVTTRIPSEEPRLTFYWEFLGGGSFSTDTAQAVTLQLGFLPSGMLQSLFVVAYVPDTEQLLTATGFGSFSAPSIPAGQLAEYDVDLSGVVVDGVDMAVQSERVVSYLAAIELVGRKTMLAEVPVLPVPKFGVPGYYLLEAWPRAGGEEDIPSYATALVWEGSAFQPLGSSDPRRQTQPGYVRFVMTPTTSEYPVTAPLSEERTYTTESGTDTWPVFFVIPAAEQLL